MSASEKKTRLKEKRRRRYVRRARASSCELGQIERRRERGIEKEDGKNWQRRALSRTKVFRV